MDDAIKVLELTYNFIICLAIIAAFVYILDKVIKNSGKSKKTGFKAKIKDLFDIGLDIENESLKSEKSSSNESAEEKVELPENKDKKNP
ncbi:MAG: hypothetical protein ACLS2V_13140 [Clostridium paraputrificum]|uniref:hypothetical protein n=1 Tax=Clostridium sp. TaxID=1506 RepID=UPI0025C7355C|nr:hypothetical protein [Clostridium sp.]MBS5926167.1 hypothetical protein [Clostridium sp.]